MARKSFDDLMAEDESAEQQSPIPAAPPRKPRTKKAATPPARTPSPDRTPFKAPVEPPRSSPKWTELERKDVLLWPEQITELVALRRQLQRHKRSTGGGGERITDNTLIRVAVAVLLEHAPALTGKDEEEIRESLSTALRDS